MAAKKFSEKSGQENTNNSSLKENENKMADSIPNEESLQLDFPNHASNDENRGKCISIDNDEKRAKFSYKSSSSEKIGDAFQENYVLPNNLSNSIFDEYSKILFPISFIVFNICYAVVCILAQK